jgi:hypothetical protein|tara:strand:- start:403 stop:750 length:348 start_codon:yes stop_codon:yes gene_type:complete
MKYDVYQIQLTNEQIAEINNSKNQPDFYNKYMSATTFPDVEKVMTARDMYSKVAVIEASTLEEVFDIGNIGPASAITRIGRMSSISVGNVVVDEYNKASLCAPFGWEEVQDFLAA